MTSSADRLNRIFHYDAAVKMEGLEYNSRSDFVTGIHEDERSKSLEEYAEINPESVILESASAAVIYKLKFDNQATRVRLEYNEENEEIGVDMEDNGKRKKFVRQLSQALDGETQVKAERALQP